MDRKQSRFDRTVCGRHCGRAYDHIDFDFQNCSKCGWDAEKEKWGESREPEQEDYEMGDADILTGRWN